MPTTFPKLSLHTLVPSNSYQSMLTRSWFEGASQTFPTGAPLKLASGLALVFVNPTDAGIAAFSLDAASGTTGAALQVILAASEVEIEANFLGSSAADNTLAAADLGLTRDLAASATLLPSTPKAAWYIADTNSDVAVRICDFKTDYVPPDKLATRPAVDDINARVRARVIAGKSLWY